LVARLLSFPSVEKAKSLSVRLMSKLNSPADVQRIAQRTTEDLLCECITDELSELIRAEIGEKLNVATDRILIVGSAKFGFALTEKKREGLLRFRPFTPQSDIDIAIIAGDLFDRIWEVTYDQYVHTREMHDWSSYYKYIFNGWIRPDMLHRKNEWRNLWFDVFSRLSNELTAEGLKISAAVYKSDTFFLRYHEQALHQCYQLKLLGQIER
jgi:hypothetical protein